VTGANPRVDPLPDPARPDTPLRVLYDEDCPFCRWTAERLRRWDRDANLRLVPYKRVKEDERLTDAVRGERLGVEVHVVDGADRVAVGGEAMLAVAALLPGGDPVVRLVRASPPARAAVNLGARLLNHWRGPLAGLLRLDGPRLNELRAS
jgi:predicted DCC family thiol-disulfide oxidoreductase YuxK